MKEHQFAKGNLLNEQGNLIDPGFSYGLDRTYSRKDIKASKWKIKEWDYYFIGDNEFGIALTIADNSYMSMASVSVLDFINKTHITKSPIGWFTFGKTNLPSTSENGDVFLKGKGFSLEFFNDNGKRHLICMMKNVKKNKDFYCDVYLEKTLDKSMVIATPFKKDKHFYYNQKINLLKAVGNFQFGNIDHKFSKDALGVLDWGRGVWTYTNTWYWSSMNGVYQGRRIGFNLGYGFGDTSAASENMLFVDDKAYKFENVKFEIPTKDGKEDYMSTWTFTSQSGDIRLKFEPLIDRYSNTNVLLIQSKQHQVFGKFSGKFLTKDGPIEFRDIIGFAEKVYNRW